MNKKVKAVVVVVLSCIGILCVVFVWRLVLGNLRQTDYDSLILKEDVDLFDPATERVVGTLPRRTVLFAPHGVDMDVTDPSDFELHKLYIRIPVDLQKPNKYVEYVGKKGVPDGTDATNGHYILSMRLHRPVGAER